MPDLNQIPGPVQITINQGDAFSARASFDESISGWTLSAAVDHSAGSTAFALSTTDPDVTFSLASSDTENIPLGNHHWYLDRTDSGSERRLLAGNFYVIRYNP